MKKCPQCKLEYFDNMLEFCLEDGARLTNVSANQPLVAEKPKTVSEETVFFPPAAEKNIHLDTAQQTKIQNTVANPIVAQTDAANAEKSKQILEVAPIVFALAHNWWQWIYLENQYYSSFTAYVFSANFLMWLLLLTAGSFVSLYSLRKSKHKGFTYASLVILAVNLLLFIVPRR